MLKDIKNFEGLYAVNESGDVWSFRSQKFLKQYDNGHGYKMVNISVDGNVFHLRVHRLVAEAFVPNPEGKSDIDHIDNCRDNNHYSNLRWVSAKENCNNVINNRKVSRRKLPVRCIETGVVYQNQTEAANAYGISPKGIGFCLCGKQRSAGGVHWEYAHK